MEHPNRVSGAQSSAYRELIITLAARHRLPTAYPLRFFVTAGGPLSYGPDTIEPYRRAAGYVDRILKGEKPGNHTSQKHHLTSDQ